VKVAAGVELLRKLILPVLLEGMADILVVVVVVAAAALQQGWAAKVAMAGMATY
jgi:hypothetical protein